MLFYRLFKYLISFAMILTLAVFVAVLGTFIFYKNELPNVMGADQSQLQLPLKIYTSDGVLIGEFGEKKRRPLKFEEIPEDLKNAFLSAEDDQFFIHRGISYPSLVRAFSQYLIVGLDATGGGTISMQVVRNYLLTREKRVERKIKEIFLALMLESAFSKEEIFELYVNRIFLGNRSYGIEAAANTYFGKSVKDLTISESALIASLAQLPSTVNPIRNPERTQTRRNWVLKRMLMLDFISFNAYREAISEDINLPLSIERYDLDASHLAELVRSEVINRYGIRAYEEGWSVFTTINSENQKEAQKAIATRLLEYDKRHGWRPKRNYFTEIGQDNINKLSAQDFSVLFSEEVISASDPLLDNENLIDTFRSIFAENIYIKSHQRGIVIETWETGFTVINEELQLRTIVWDEIYEWMRKYIDENTRGTKPSGFSSLLRPGDFIYLVEKDGELVLDQIPDVQSSILSYHPKTGAVIAYVGGSSFTQTQFDRVRQSFPQTGSAFKPFIYAAAFNQGYRPSNLINDAPIIFDDANLETYWRPENYSGEFYGLTSLREALVQSINIVSIKLLRELGIDTATSFISNFGFEDARIPKDLSLALGSGNFSPAEVARAFGVFANQGMIPDLYYVLSIEDKNGNIIYQYKKEEEINVSSLNAFPWFTTVQLDASKPYYLLKPLNQKEPVIDPRITFLVKDILTEAAQRGSNGRLTRYLSRKDFAGKTGTTNDAVSTWFTGFHSDLVTTIWVGNDDFQSLGDNEFGSTTALPIWVDYMGKAFPSLEPDSNEMPDGISYIRVDKRTGKQTQETGQQTYFDLFFSEDLN